MKFNTDMAAKITYGLSILTCVILSLAGVIGIANGDNAIINILMIYYLGAVAAYVIAFKNIKKYKTKDNPFYAAIFSWILIFMVVVVYVVKLFRR